MSDSENKPPNEPEKTPCLDCGIRFFVSDKDKKFYDKLGYELPKRCFYCRKKNRLKREKTEE